MGSSTTSISHRFLLIRLTRIGAQGNHALPFNTEPKTVDGIGPSIQGPLSMTALFQRPAGERAIFGQRRQLLNHFRTTLSRSLSSGHKGKDN